jgi:predicted ATPase/DNA-binding CsgD family transcriptional regulator
MSEWPIRLTTFVGRDDERAAVAERLGKTRLVTLTGIGGVGKTRLALEIGADVQGVYRDRAWFIELASVVDPGAVPQRVAAALGISETAGERPVDTLTRALQRSQCLLILDNCEHLVEACAGLADQLLRACPDMRILATSRQALAIEGETVWSVPPLPLPGAGLTGNDEIGASAAVRLFCDRARSALPSFALSDLNAAPVARICQRLDGIPLAIELAAARMNVLSPDEMLNRLADRFRMLRGSNRSASSRHHTLRATLDWSYELLTTLERVLLRRLAVFHGGWSLEAAESVCTDGDMAVSEVFDVLNALVDKSVVVADLQGVTARYHLLETVRQYAWEALSESGEAESLQSQHAAFYVALAEEAATYFLSPVQTIWMQRLDREHDNLRAALRYTLDVGDSSTSLRMAGALGWFWILRGNRSEGLQSLERVLACTGTIGAPDASRARSQVWAAKLAGAQGDGDHAVDLFERALGEFRALGDRTGIAWVLSDLGEVERERGHYDRTEAMLTESLTIRRELGDEHGIAMTLTRMAQVARDQGDDLAVKALLDESLDLFRQRGDVHRIAHSLDNLGIVARRQGQLQRARDLHEEALAMLRQLGDKEGIGAALQRLALVAWRDGDAEQAISLCREACATYQDVHYPTGVADCLESLGEITAGRGQFEIAASLLGAAEALREAIRMPRPPADALEYDSALAIVRANVSESTFLREWQRGRSQPLEVILCAPDISPTAKERAPSPLTTREHDVTWLVAQGLTNNEISERLIVSIRTVEAHVTHVLTKLGLRSRAQLAIWALEHGLVGPAQGPVDCGPNRP